ncbi:armadillo repeat protein deleted in velo-cardio-facial syndrome isoform X1 [Lates japonicus]|uniref:Armadillo repeat protein deleted in velo-cardio-facial syndrome isoform X1 n=1 Tax=Lates japonicus TaxID=270547 RepID=A0AAD3RN42_LATJO|nr:armadillo repeat protein deleted in velo-cardio-facial syndrome isoform X1 [Lates japonicus]GLD74522.1 armadillo repeat protein deleted in velo-cardio-facial syndrome isoform X1 [Lates japonicus]
MEDYDVRSAASIMASVKEQEARFEQLTRALEEERRNVTLQLERANLPPNPTTSQPLAWQQVVMQVNDARVLANNPLSFSTTSLTHHVSASLLTSLK